MSLFQNIKFTGADFIKALTFCLTMYTLYYNLKIDVYEAAAMDRADKVIINSRLDVLEKTMATTSKSTEDVKREIFKIRAILSKQVKLEDYE